MSIKAQLTRTVASSWLSLAVVSICQLVAVPIALGALTKVDFALFAIITQVIMAVMLTEAGARSACARLLIGARAEGNDAYHRMWMASNCVFSGQSLLMLLIVLGFSPFFGDIFHLESAQRSTAWSVFVTVGALNVVRHLFSIYPTALMAGQKLVQINNNAAVAAILQLGAFVAGIRMGAGLWAYPIGMAVGMAYTQIMSVYQVRKYKLAGRFDLELLLWSEVKVVLLLGFDVFVSALFSLVMGNSLLLFSGYVLTLEQTAVLAVNLKLVGMMTQILQRIPGSAGPTLMKLVSENQDQQFRMWWKIVTKLTISVAIFGAGLFVFWNRLVISWWTSADMVMPLGAVLLLSLVPFRFLVHFQFVNSLAIFKELRRVKLVLVWEVLLYSALALLLGKWLGLDGLLAANLLSMFGGSLFYGMRWFARYAGIPFGNLVALLSRITIPLILSLGLVIGISGGLSRFGIVGNLGLSTLWSLLFLVIGYWWILDAPERNRAAQMIASARRLRA